MKGKLNIIIYFYLKLIKVYINPVVSPGFPPDLPTLPTKQVVGQTTVIQCKLDTSHPLVMFKMS